MLPPPPPKIKKNKNKVSNPSFTDKMKGKIQFQVISLFVLIKKTQSQNDVSYLF